LSRQKAPIEVPEVSETVEDVISKIDSSKGEHIAAVRIYINGYLCSECIAPIRRTLQEEDGVKIVAENPETGMIEIVPTGDTFLNLRNIRQRINGTRVLSVVKMEVIAAGKVVKLTQQYYSNSPHAHVHD
jgi:hypothetical protein